MWPDLFGAGSWAGLFVAGSILTGLGAMLWFAMRTARRSGPDPVAVLWNRYEQGDLTAWEAARLFRIFAAQQAAADAAARRLAAAWRAEAEGVGWGLRSPWTAEPVEPGRAESRGR